MQEFLRQDMEQGVSYPYTMQLLRQLMGEG
jgi:hypothetical protein